LKLGAFSPRVHSSSGLQLQRLYEGPYKTAHNIYVKKSPLLPYDRVRAHVEPLETQ
jgi:hypothetical protein